MTPGRVDLKVVADRIGAVRLMVGQLRALPVKSLDEFRAAGFRNRLTHFYEEVTAEELHGILVGDLDDLLEIASELEKSAARLASG